MDDTWKIIDIKALDVLCGGISSALMGRTVSLCAYLEAFVVVNVVGFHDLVRPLVHHIYCGVKGLIIRLVSSSLAVNTYQSDNVYMTKKRRIFTELLLRLPSSLPNPPLQALYQYLT